MASPSRIGGRALSALLPDVHQMPGPVYSALAHAVTSLVLDGRVATETRLPSERELAAALHLSRATVTAAYDTLRGEGFLTSRTGSGSYVTVPVGSGSRGALARWSPIGSAIGSDAPDVIDLSCAAPSAPPNAVPDAVATAATRLGPYLVGDGYDPAGLPVAREAVAARFTARGLPTRPEQILITNGALHGLDLLLRLLVGPGDRIITELPTYPGALDATRAAGARLVPVPMASAGGWQVSALQAALRQSAARLAYLVPDFHNPTGALVPEADRRDVLRAAHRAGTTVVVDESFVEVGFARRETPTAALDASVITLGSLSKPIWGGLRIGWLRGPAELVQRLAALRTAIDMGSPVIDQLVASILLGRMDELSAARIAELQPRRDALLAALARELPQWRAQVPAGGLSLWAELDAPMSTPLTLLAAQLGVVIVPGSRFGVDGTLERFLRIPFALPAERLDDAVHRIAGAWTQLERTGGATRRLVVA